MATLYLVEQGAQVQKEYQRLLVCKEGEVLQEVPIGRVERVVVLGRIGFTTPALLALLDADIPVVFLTQQGQVRGGSPGGPEATWLCAIGNTNAAATRPFVCRWRALSFPENF